MRIKVGILMAIFENGFLVTLFRSLHVMFSKFYTVIVSKASYRWKRYLLESKESHYKIKWSYTFVK